MNPFRLQDVLIRNEPSDWFLQKIADEIPVVISDNSLLDYTLMRKIVIESPAVMWKTAPNGRNFIDYYDCRQFFGNGRNDLQQVVSEVIQGVFGVQTEQDGDLCSNYFKQINGKRSDFSIPHSDQSWEVPSFTAIVYLNNLEECSGGTAFFKHKKSNCLWLNQKDSDYFYQQYPDVTENGFDYWCDEKRNEWDIVGSVEMRPGRVIIFPSEFFHAAFHPIDSFYDFPRLTLVHWQRSFV